MRQSTLSEAKWNTLSFNILLPDASNDLAKTMKTLNETKTLKRGIPNDLYLIGFKMSMWHSKVLTFITMKTHTCDTLISDPLDPATTMTLKLLNSVNDLLADAPVLSRASLSIRLT